MKKTFVSVLLGSGLIASSVFAKPSTISDSLVKDLSCQSLSISSILSKIRSDAFASSNHMPLRNWGFKSGLVNIGACWGMGSTQRKFFYLMRLNEKNAPKPNISGVLDMVEGGTSRYSVIPVEEQSIREAYYHNTGTSFMEYMFAGVNGRNIKTEIEKSQERHFFRSGNLEMGAGTGPRRTSINRQTVKELMRNIDAKRLPLINLRLKMRVQHIVIPKSYVKDAKGNVWFNAYDSNQPETDKKIYYSAETGHFYSPEIMGLFSLVNVNDENIENALVSVDSINSQVITLAEAAAPLGVFIVDEQERGHIEASLLRYYQNRCQ